MSRGIGNIRPLAGLIPPTVDRAPIRDDPVTRDDQDDFRSREQDRVRDQDRQRDREADRSDRSRDRPDRDDRSRDLRSNQPRIISNQGPSRHHINESHRNQRFTRQGDVGIKNESETLIVFQNFAQRITKYLVGPAPPIPPEVAPPIWTYILGVPDSIDSQSIMVSQNGENIPYSVLPKITNMDPKRQIALKLTKDGIQYEGIFASEKDGTVMLSGPSHSTIAVSHPDVIEGILNHPFDPRIEYIGIKPIHDRGELLVSYLINGIYAKTSHSFGLDLRTRQVTAINSNVDIVNETASIIDRTKVIIGYHGEDPVHLNAGLQSIDGRTQISIPSVTPIPFERIIYIQTDKREARYGYRFPSSGFFSQGDAYVYMVSELGDMDILLGRTAIPTIRAGDNIDLIIDSTTRLQFNKLLDEVENVGQEKRHTLDIQISNPTAEGQLIVISHALNYIPIRVEPRGWSKTPDGIEFKIEVGPTSDIVFTFQIFSRGSAPHDQTDDDVRQDPEPETQTPAPA